MGWVPDGAGGYRGQMAVLVKPNGLFGKLYFAAIAPFRYLIVYPALMRGIRQEWQAGMQRGPLCDALRDVRESDVPLRAPQ